MATDHRGTPTGNNNTAKTNAERMGGFAGAIASGLHDSIHGGKNPEEWAEYDADPSAHAVGKIGEYLDKVPGVTRLK